MNLGFKSKLMRSRFKKPIRTNMICSLTSVESYVESSLELRCKSIFEYVMVVSFSRLSTGPRALFRGDYVVMHTTMTTLPPIPYIASLLFLLPLPLSLDSSALSELSLILSYHK